MEYDKKQRIYKTVMLIILVAIITFIATTIFIYNYLGNNKDTKYVMLPTIDKGVTSEISKVKAIIDKYYMGDIDEQELLDSALVGYVEGLNDEYSEYIPKSEMESFEAETTGNYNGIGIYYGKTTDNKIVIVSPIKDSPAAKAGLLPGDEILKVDDYEVTSESTLTDLSNIIKGEVGKSVKLKIQRGDQILEFDVPRENIKLHQINTEVLENQIGYMDIYSFDEGTSDQFKDKYNELKEQGIKGLIIDLRNNPGGIVKEATGIADAMLEKGKTILITKDKDGKEEITKSEEDPIVVDVPIILLTNNNSASAAEILAGALKDNGVAKIIGEKTYGKGVIQNVFTLSSGAGLKITTNEYFTPNNNKINKIGIEPDIEVSLPEDIEDELNIPFEQDTQLKRAIEELK